MADEIVEPSDNIFEVLGFEKEEAENLRIRARLMQEITSFIKDKDMTIRGAAAFFGVSHPRISDLQKGRINKFKIDYLLELLSKAGKRMTIQIEDMDPV